MTRLATARIWMSSNHGALWCRSGSPLRPHRAQAKPACHRRAWWIYFLAFVPGGDHRHSPGSSIRTRTPRSNEDTKVLAGIIQLYYVRLGVFFGCLGIFSRLIRGEMIERSLHYYLCRRFGREVILLAKFCQAQ